MKFFRQKVRVLHLFVFLSVLLIVLYTLSALADIQNLILSITLGTSFLLMLKNIIGLPLSVYLNTSAVVFGFFVINALLLSFYMTLFMLLLQNSVKTTGKKFGLFGATTSVLSTGCAACGSIITPLLLATSLSVPLAFLSHLDIMLAILSTSFLVLSIFILLRNR